MKTQFLNASVLMISILLFASCSKSNTTPDPTPAYTSGQGKITGSGGASFTTEGTAAFFKKTVDTVVVQANIDPSANFSKQFIIAIVAKTPGTYNFISNAGSSTATSGAAAYYRYGGMNSAGTLIDHEYLTNSGTVVITSMSATGITGTYTANMIDVNNNNDAPISVSGSFSGSF